MHCNAADVNHARDASGAGSVAATEFRSCCFQCRATVESARARQATDRWRTQVDLGRPTAQWLAHGDVPFFPRRTTAMLRTGACGFISDSADIVEAGTRYGG